MIGTRLKHYEIVRKLGSGGMGDVYAARDQNLGREVALKILPPAMARDADRLERFRREATTVAALDHPNIVTVFSIEEAVPQPPDDEPVDAGPVHFITMQLVEGRTLDEVIPRRGLSLDKFFNVAVPLADAVAAAHEKGITHRDLKPTNIMVTPEGRVKVLDFGLAKLTQPETSAGSDAAATQAATAGPITEEGKILGTAAYMSPEQAEGLPVDHRTDIFSLGIILYEMATGEAPFRGDSRISILSSVVSHEPPPVSEVNRMTPRHLGRIIGHSLEKDAKRRFQSALDLRNEIEGLKREVDSGESVAAGSGPVAKPTRRGKLTEQQAVIAMIAMIALFGIFVGITKWFERADDPATPANSPAAVTPGAGVQPVSAVDNRPSIAVLYFDNTSGDEDLDWLRTGLPEMLVTDLSQSRGIRVLTTDRVYGALADAGVVDAGASAALDAVGDSLGVDRVLLGSVLRAGDRIRIVARLQDVSSGEIIASETLDGDSEEDLFDLVDQLTMSIRATFTGLGVGGETDRDVTEVTTSSVEALRLWVEADRLMNLAEYELARERLERAVQIDPEFAMAYAKLAIVAGNLEDLDLRTRYAEAALQYADHLTERERYYVEATYYLSRWNEADRAEQALRRMLDFDPSSTAARNNLAIVLQWLDRDEEAIAHYEVLIENEVDFVGSWTNLAEAYADEGRFEDAEDVLRRLAARQPESGVPYDALAELYLRQGRYDDVQEAVQEALRRGWDLARRYEADIGVLTRRWEMAGAIVEIGAGETEPGIRFGSIPFGRRDIALYQGQSQAAIDVLRAAIDEVPERGTFTSWLYDGMSYVYEARGDLDQAIHYVELAGEDARRNEDIMWEMALLGRMQAQSGQVGAARATQSSLIELTADWPPALVARHLAQLAATIATATGEHAQAIRLLEGEARKLDPSGQDDPPHCAVWFHLANAHIAAGDREAALPWLQRITEATTERTGFAYEYVYSLYLLGSIHDELGNEQAARASYELFLEHWGEGDLRREEVEAARNWLAAH